ncbi:hypothetical protein WISP_59774 [Willisornis vidua]|uniref:Uncharacterized protein n=1 Tax=Willisornis vidua TaxID=1566151 RepID=A0ABQ9DH34_9PASS|nr:hypothetical protein WISP_59774 [Willisornis vidua]
MDSETECTLRKFPNYTKLCGAVDMLKEVMPSRGTLTDLKVVNIMKFNKANFKKFWSFALPTHYIDEEQQKGYMVLTYPLGFIWKTTNCSEVYSYSCPP